jgi:hypothetical protein
MRAGSFQEARAAREEYMQRRRRGLEITKGRHGLKSRMSVVKGKLQFQRILRLGVKVRGHKF